MLRSSASRLAPLSMSVALAAAACGPTVLIEQTKGSAAPGEGGGTPTSAATTTSIATVGSGGSEASSTVASTSTVASASSTGTGGFVGYPAPHPAPPQLMNQGGPILAAPKIVPVFFSNDDPTIKAQLKDFIAKVGSSAYWLAAVGEYGVGPATALPPIELSEAAPDLVDQSDLETFLTGKLDANDPAFLPADGETIYVLFYPESTTITAFGGASCQLFGGYHESTALDAAHASERIVYAVIPRCPAFVGQLDLLGQATAATSHELIEASTDPIPDQNPGWQKVDDAHLYWAYALGYEAGDLCAASPSAFGQVAGFEYSVQRSWSNQSASADHDPCVPAPQGQAYFNAVPVLEDDVVAYPPPYLGPVTMKGVTIPVGGTKTIDVDLFSDGPTPGPWTIEAIDANDLYNTGSRTLSLMLDTQAGQNGDKVHLTIDVLGSGPYGFESFVLFSTLGDQVNVWVGAVGN